MCVVLLRLAHAACADIDDLAAQQHRNPEVDDEVQKHGVGRDRCRPHLEVGQFKVG
jgi:hypothetical protein